MSAPEIARKLHAVGLAVFACQADKTPAVPRGESWKDPIYQYPLNTYWPSELVGVVIPVGVIVFDLDTYKKDAEGRPLITRAKVDKFFGVELPWDAALIQATPQGGQHYAFRVLQDWQIRQCSPLPGLDLRVAGKGYIATGRPYGETHFSDLLTPVATE